jgi:hypothetical protein
VFWELYLAFLGTVLGVCGTAFGVLGTVFGVFGNCIREYQNKDVYVF